MRAGRSSIMVTELCFLPKEYLTNIPKNAGVTDKKTNPNYQPNDDWYLATTLPLCPLPYIAKSKHGPSSFLFVLGQ